MSVWIARSTAIAAILSVIAHGCRREASDAPVPDTHVEVTTAPENAPNAPPEPEASSSRSESSDSSAGEAEDTGAPEAGSANEGPEAGTAFNQEGEGASADSAPSKGPPRTGKAAKPLPGPVEPLNPQEAASRAIGLRDQGRDSKRKGDDIEAYQFFVRAWNLVRQHPTDKRCRDLAAALLKEIERTAESIEQPATAGDGGILGKAATAE